MAQSDPIQADSVETDTITSDTTHLFIALPNPPSSNDMVSGSYLRLGTYRAEDASYVPGNFDKDKNAANASGLFLKTNGTLLLTVDSGAYQEFKNLLNVKVAGDMTFTGLKTAKLTAPQVQIHANSSLNSSSGVSKPGDVSVKGSTVDINAGTGNVTIYAKNQIKQKSDGSKWQHIKGEWKSLAHGERFSYFGGVKIDFLVGLMLKFTGTVSLTIGTFDIKVCAIGDLKACTAFTLKFVPIDFKAVTIDAKTCNIELKNGDITVHKDSIFAKKELFKVTDVTVGVDKSMVLVEKEEVVIDTASIMRIFM